MLMGRALIEINEAHEEVLLHLDDMKLQIKLVDHKINLLEKRIVDLDLSNLDYPQAQVHVVDEHPPLV
jgi:hypothetical protein